MTSEPETEAEATTGTDADGDGDTDLPESVVEEAERLTRLARNAVDPNEADAHRDRRARLLDAHDYTARLRTDDRGETLVLHPEEWEVDGRVDVERVDDVDRAVEVPLDGTGDPEDWETVEAHNRAVAERVREAHGEVHGANADAFADFMGNHYARPVEEATPAMREEFLTEYFPRNAWPTDDQREAVEASLDLVDEES